MAALTQVVQWSGVGSSPGEECGTDLATRTRVVCPLPQALRIQHHDFVCGGIHPCCLVFPLRVFGCPHNMRGPRTVYVLEFTSFVLEYALSTRVLAFCVVRHANDGTA